MKKVIFSALMLFAVQGAFAYMEVHEVATSSAIARGIDVSSYTYTMLENTTAYLLSGRYKEEIFNASTDTINCGFNVSVSTVSADTFYGRPIATLTSWIINISDKMRIYCKGTGTNISSRVVFIQYK